MDTRWLPHGRALWTQTCTLHFISSIDTSQLTHAELTSHTTVYTHHRLLCKGKYGLLRPLLVCFMHTHTREETQRNGHYGVQGKHSVWMLLGKKACVSGSIFTLHVLGKTLDICEVSSFYLFFFLLSLALCIMNIVGKKWSCCLFVSHFG